MFARSTPVLCIVPLLLFAASAHRSAPSELRPTAVSAQAALSRSRAADPQLTAPSAVPAHQERSNDRKPAMRTRTMRAVLRELLPEISLIAVLPFPQREQGPFDAAVSRSGRETGRGPADGSRTLFSGLSPPA